MKLTCMLQCYNENTHRGWDGRTNLHRFLESVVKYCDSLVVYDDESLDTSVDLIESYRGRFQDLVVLRGEKNAFANELAHKQQMLDVCRKIGTDRILWLDADEVIEPSAERGSLRYLAENMQKGAVNFRQVNLWRTDRFYRIDELWAQGLFCRLWRLTPALHYDVKPGLHQDLAPKGIEGRNTTQLRVIHYGFSSSDNILRKYHTYKAHGQSGRALDRLIDERTLRVRPATDAEVPLAHGPGREVFQKPLRSLL